MNSLLDKALVIKAVTMLRVKRRIDLKLSDSIDVLLVLCITCLGTNFSCVQRKSIDEVLSARDVFLVFCENLEVVDCIAAE